MEPAVALLFTSPTCPHCPNAKEIFDKVQKERDDADFHNILLTTPENQELAKKFGVMSVPTFIIYGPEHEKPMGLRGTHSKETINKYVDIALGKQKLEEKKPKKPVFKKIFSK
ncbi:MAG: thioredoxin domain-containing protein [Nanobdellota archaeon]